MRRAGKTSVFVRQISNIPAELRRTLKKMNAEATLTHILARVAQNKQKKSCMQKHYTLYTIQYTWVKAECTTWNSPYLTHDPKTSLFTYENLWDLMQSNY